MRVVLGRGIGASENKDGELWHDDTCHQKITIVGCK